MKIIKENKNLRHFCKNTPQLAKVPLILAVHSKLDEISSYRDTETVVHRIVLENGNAVLQTVPDDMAVSIFVSALEI